MASRFRNIRGVRRQVRETLWLDVATTESILGGAPTAVLANSLNAAALALRPFTIVRTRGIFSIRSDQIAASETFMGDLGYAVVSDQAVAIGVTAVPTPLTDKGSDLFFVYEQLVGRIDFSDATGIATNSITIHYDSKGMRRVNDDQDIVVVLENEIAGIAATHSARMLVKLH